MNKCYVVNENGKRGDILLSLEEYEHTLEELEYILAYREAKAALESRDIYR